MAKRKKKLGNKYERIIDAELDLHGLRRYEAIHELRDFLNDVRRSDALFARIITGKGNRSPDGVAVIANMTKAYLIENGYDYTVAKQHEGGDGALIVSLQ